MMGLREIWKRRQERKEELRASAEAACHRTIRDEPEKYAAMHQPGWFVVSTEDLCRWEAAEWQYGPPQEELRGIIGGVTVEWGMIHKYRAWMDIGFMPTVYEGRDLDLAMYRVEEGFKHMRGGVYEALGPDPRITRAQNECAANLVRLGRWLEGAP